ncbi:YkyA family protein [Paenibacillus sp. W2I17]|uniref:YkyA family protein n=1 Tax=Paenibacillus sp. W2I17 TaxID=3042311 RepID=UPI002788C498|nr:YkyA family protein [Paenibacillus sp. W2I17]MDQ0661086.1 septal ring factor EnvC (AmiA/AmiB activator) [Paenibacillus sp. W2I17]
MLTSKKVALAAVSVLLILLASGCGDPQEPAANQINQLVLSGQEIDQSLKTLTSHEQEDMKLYKSILDKGKNKNSDLEALLDQAADHIYERRTLLKQAEEAMKQTNEKTVALRSSLKELSFEKEETLAQAEKVLDQYEARARALENFVASYQLSLSADEQLYDLMRESAEPNLVKIKRAIRVRNSEYAKLAEFRKQFNLQTKAFNGANAKLVQMDQAS